MGSLKLHLGCGMSRMEGWVNCDLHPGPKVDLAFDVQQPWPFPDNAVTEIFASHMLEHLSDPHAFFREAWRVLQPNGSIRLRMPYGDHKSAWWDLTHRQPWYAESFCCLQPGYADSVGNPQASAWRWYFGLGEADLRIGGKFWRWTKWRLGRYALGWWGEHIPNLIEELFIGLYALKREEDVAAYAATHRGNEVSVRYVIYRHQTEGRELRPGELPALVPLAALDLMNGFHTWG